MSHPRESLPKAFEESSQETRRMRFNSAPMPRSAPEVVRALPIHPKIWRLTEEPPETQSRVNSRHFDVVGITITPHEADPSSSIDADRMLTETSPWNDPATRWMRRCKSRSMLSRWTSATDLGSAA
jgi:hypothetical protein